MKKIVESLLKKIAAAVVKKYQPKVIGITGSVGKTSTKEAIYAVLKFKYKSRVVQSVKNYNNELGVPLTILRSESGGKSIAAWMGIIGKGIGLLLKHDPAYPEIFVLEMGADHVGDIKYLLEIAPCKVGVLTAIGQSHLEFFGSIENIAAEKSQIITKLPADGLAVINRDDELVYTYKNKTKAKVVSYGFKADADLRASDLVVSETADTDVERVERIKGISFKLSSSGSAVPFHIPGVLGYQHVYAALAAAAVGVYFGMNMIEIVQAMDAYEPAPGRMNLISGIKKSLIVDDSYNSAPASAKAALDAMGRIDLPKPAEKWAALGDMLELGSYTEQGHQEVGQKAFETGMDYVVAVGERARDIARAARAAGMAESKVYEFPTSDEAAKFMQGRIEKGDLILVKGSQGARMEKIVKELMADPLSAPILLTRQGPEWQK